MHDRTNDPAVSGKARGAERPDDLSGQTLAGIFERLQRQPITDTELGQIAAVLGCTPAPGHPGQPDDERASRPPTLRERGEDFDLWPTPAGPWYPAGEDGRFDHGMRWCVSATCHPQNQSGSYPHPDHGPADECRSRWMYVSDALDGFDGAERQVIAYAAHPFTFGEPVDAELQRRARLGSRIVLEVADGDDDITRVSMPVGSALLLARGLGALVDTVTGIGAQSPGGTS